MNYPELPTIEQAQEFLRLVNVGREALGLETLETLPFDEAEPQSPYQCLSATALFNTSRRSDETYIWSTTIEDVSPVLVGALDLEEVEVNSAEHHIPPAILAVTAPFDADAPGLRERLVEAGVVA